jgi:hypothetical protein
MPEDLPEPPPRFRGVISMVLVIMIFVMVVRDVLMRRRAGAAPPASA